MENSNVRLILVVLLVLSLYNSVSYYSGVSESIFLSTAQAGGSSSSTDIGLIAWISIGKYIDLGKASALFTTIDYENTDGILGKYSFYVDNYNTETINLYITRDGYIAAFYGKYDATSKMISWNSDKTVSSKFATAITTVGQSLGYNVDYKNIKYYDYRYPDANRILIVTQSVGESNVQGYDYGNFKFNIPSYATIYDVSYSLYLNDIYNNLPGSNIAIDTDTIDSISSNGVIYGTYGGYISKDTDHLLGIMSNQNAQSGVAMIIIYKDDADKNNNSPTIVVQDADNYFDWTLDNPESTGQSVPTGQSTPTYTPSSTPTPTPRRTPRITVPIPTVEITNEPTPEITYEDTTPVPKITRGPPKPPKASVDLHGERTNIEEGQQSLLKGSIVSFNTNKYKMHAQVIIIPPSGVSVVSADFVKSPAGQYTSDFELEPGKGKDIEVAIVPNEPGEFKVVSKVTYYFGDDKDDNGYEETKLDIKVKPKYGSDSGTIGKTNKPVNTPIKEEPGFEMIFSIGILIVSCSLFKKRK